MDCPRGRPPVATELAIDGRTLFAASLPPGGLSGDGQSQVYKRFTVPAGEHEIVARLRDTPRDQGFDYERTATITLASGQSLAVTLAPRRSSSGPPTLAVVPASGGAPTATFPNTMSASFSPDGTQLCAVQGDDPVFSTLGIVPVTGGPAVPTGITAAFCAWRPAGAASGHPEDPQEAT